MSDGIRITDRSAIRALARLEAEAPMAIQRGLQKLGLLIGRLIAGKAPRKLGRLARSFLTPVVSGSTVIIGRGVPIYGAIHEYGGVIRAKNAPFLVFEIDGQVIRTKQVTIKEKRFARDGLAEGAVMGPTLIGREIVQAFHD